MTPPAAPGLHRPPVPKLRTPPAVTSWSFRRPRRVPASNPADGSRLNSPSSDSGSWRTCGPPQAASRQSWSTSGRCMASPVPNWPRVSLKLYAGPHAGRASSTPLSTSSTSPSWYRSGGAARTPPDCPVRHPREASATSHRWRRSATLTREHADQPPSPPQDYALHFAPRTGARPSPAYASAGESVPAQPPAPPGARTSPARSLT